MEVSADALPHPALVLESLLAPQAAISLPWLCNHGM